VGAARLARHLLPRVDRYASTHRLFRGEPLGHAADNLNVLFSRRGHVTLLYTRTGVFVSSATWNQQGPVTLAVVGQGDSRRGPFLGCWLDLFLYIVSYRIVSYGELSLIRGRARM
jgi:hypothetical protein